MYRRFVPTEFTAFHILSWLRQFKSAMRIRELYPRDALRALLDTDLKRWTSICDNISDIELVEKAIEFLGEQSEITKTCCEDLHKDISKTIAVVKKAAYPRRSKATRDKLARANEMYRKLILELEQVEKDIAMYKEEFKQLENNNFQRMAELQALLVAEGQIQMRLTRQKRTTENNINVLNRYLNTLK